MTLLSSARLGPYEILGFVGEGGMGEVYRARDTQLKQDVALKVLPADVAADPDRLARFRREAELLAALNHPHICTLYGLGEAFPPSPEPRPFLGNGGGRRLNACRRPRG